MRLPHLCPVGHNVATEAMLATQIGGEQIISGCHTLTVDQVVAGHDGVGIRGLNDHAEGLEVDLAQGTLGDVGADLTAGRLLVVGGKVLEGHAHALGLNTVGVSGGDKGRKDGILRDILKVTAAQHVFLNIHTGG